MNISSLVVWVKDEEVELLIKKLNESGICECHAHANNQLIVTIEGVDNSEELSKLNLIKQHPEVLAVDLIYTYSEDELELARQHIEFANPVPDWLNDENADASGIRYSGNFR